MTVSFTSSPSLQTQSHLRLSPSRITLLNMLITGAQRQQMGTPHPDFAAAIEQSPMPDMTRGNPDASIHDIRKNRAEHLAALRHLYPIPGPVPNEVTESNHHVPARDGHHIPVRIYVPRKPKQDGKSRPLIVMYHEGGWTRGDLTDEDLNCRMFSRDLGAVCVNVDYRLVPEWPFPYGVNDAFDILKWCATNAFLSSDLLPADPREGFIVGGASAGGNFAAVMCQVAKDEGLTPPLTGQYLCVPALLDESAVPEKWQSEFRSRFEGVNDPVIVLQPGRSSKKLEILQVKPEDPRYSPALRSNLRGLPPAFLQVCGLDPLRDEALIYEQMLKESAVSSRMIVYSGFGHMFWTNWPKLEQSKTFVQETLAGLKWLLSRRSSS